MSVKLKKSEESATESTEEKVIDEGASKVEIEIRKLENDARREVSENLSSGKLPDTVTMTADDVLRDIGLRCTKLRNVCIASLEAISKRDLTRMKTLIPEISQWSRSLEEAGKTI